MSGEKSVSDQLAEFKEHRHVTSEQLASVLGISRQALWYWENGHRQPGPRNRAKLISLGILPAPPGPNVAAAIAAARQKLAVELGVDAGCITIMVEGHGPSAQEPS
jgi:transcriptional regulator with XRE-family HTH domain